MSDQDELIAIKTMYDGLIKAIDKLVRLNRIQKHVVDVIKPVLEFTYNTVKDHDCGAGHQVLAEVARAMLHVGSSITAFEDHLQDHDEVAKSEAKVGEAPSTPDTNPVTATNVVQLDLSKGKRRDN